MPACTEHANPADAEDSEYSEYSVDTQGTQDTEHTHTHAGLQHEAHCNQTQAAATLEQQSQQP